MFKVLIKDSMQRGNLKTGEADMVVVVVVVSPWYKDLQDYS